MAQPARIHWLHCLLLIIALPVCETLYSQTEESKLHFSVHGGPVMFDEVYGLHNTAHYSLAGAMRVNKNLQALARGGFIPARQSFSTAVGVRDVKIGLYELSIGAKFQAPKFFSPRLHPFFSLMGGVLFYRPQTVNVPIGLIDVKIDPPDATKPMFSAAAGIDWKLTKAIGLSLGFEAKVSRITERFFDGASHEQWRPFYAAAVGIIGRIK